VTDVLVITSSVRVLHGIHCHTADDGPAVAFGFVLVVSATSFQHRLVNATTSSDDTDLTTGIRLDDLLGSRGETEASLVGLLVVRDNGAVVTGGAGDSTAVTGALLDVGHDGSLRHGTERKDVSDLKSGLASAVHELTGVQTLNGNEVLLHGSILVRVTELHASERSSSAGVVDDLTHNSFNISVALTEIVDAQLGSSLAVLVVRAEDKSVSLSLTLGAKWSSHLCSVVCCLRP
jgi:hypothetical protein